MRPSPSRRFYPVIAERDLLATEPYPTKNTTAPLHPPLFLYLRYKLILIYKMFSKSFISVVLCSLAASPVLAARESRTYFRAEQLRDSVLSCQSLCDCSREATIHQRFDHPCKPLLPLQVGVVSKTVTPSGCCPSVRPVSLAGRQFRLCRRYVSKVR